MKYFAESELIINPDGSISICTLSLNSSLTRLFSLATLAELHWLPLILRPRSVK